MSDIDMSMVVAEYFQKPAVSNRNGKDEQPNTNQAKTRTDVELCKGENER